jgi:hypothetical protein
VRSRHLNDEGEEMTDSPAAAGRTTRNLRRVGATAAALSGAFISSIVATEASAALHGGAPGAHFSLYAGAILSAVVAASCLSFAFARRLISRQGEKLARIGEKLDDLITVQQRREYETGLMAAELADLVATTQQLVAESARWRAADRERAEMVEAMALVVERLGLRVEELERITMRAMIVAGSKSTTGDTKILQMPPVDTVRAARNLASRMIAAERRLHEDNPEDNLS